MHTESKIQGNNNASRRGGDTVSLRQNNICLSQRRDNTASRRGGNTVSLRQNSCLSQRRDNTASRRGGNTVSLRQNDIVSRRDGKKTRRDQIIVSTLRPNADNRDAFQWTRNSLDTFHLTDKRCHVCRDFTAARCDHRATGYTWLSNVFKIACACSSHAMRGQTRLLKIKIKFPWKHTKLRAGFNWQS